MDKETIDFFNTVNKAECFLHKLKRNDSCSYFKLKDEAFSLEDAELDYVIFDCVFVEEPKLVRYVIDTIDISNVESDFDFALKKIEGAKLRFWRDLLKGNTSVAEELELLYLNYFTLFTGRTGGGINERMLANFGYLEGQFIREKQLAKLLTFSNVDFSSTHTIKLSNVRDAQRVILEKSNSRLEEQILALGGNINEAD